MQTFRKVYSEKSSMKSIHNEVRFDPTSRAWESVSNLTSAGIRMKLWDLVDPTRNLMSAIASAERELMENHNA
jgi:hypothetical protein